MSYSGCQTVFIFHNFISTGKYNNFQNGHSRKIYFYRSFTTIYGVNMGCAANPQFDQFIVSVELNLWPKRECFIRYSLFYFIFFSLVLSNIHDLASARLQYITPGLTPSTISHQSVRLCRSLPPFSKRRSSYSQDYYTFCRPTCRHCLQCIGCGLLGKHCRSNAYISNGERRTELSRTLFSCIYITLLYTHRTAHIQNFRVFPRRPTLFDG